MTDLYIRITNEDELSEYECDQTVITKKRYLPSISGANYKAESSPSRCQPVEWYPFVNSCYPYTEDVDAFARVNHLIESNPSFESLTTINEATESSRGDSYSESGAQLQYLQSRPICFLIVGKPDIGQQKLGRLLADYWKCVYIDPEILIQEEITAATRAGNCIEFNLRCGRAIGVDILLRLLEKRVRTQSAQHRGFVVTGFPLIHNDLYTEDPVSSESAVFTAQEIFDEIFQVMDFTLPPIVVGNVSEASKIRKDEIAGEGGQEETEIIQEEEPGERYPMEEQPLPTSPPSRLASTPLQAQTMLDVGSTYTDICIPGDIGINYEEQLNFIFNQFGNRFVLIYVMCPNPDVISKHAEYRFDVTTEDILDMQEHRLNKYMYTVFSKESGTVRDLPEEFFEKSEIIRAREVDYNDYRQFVKLPHHFSGSVAAQLERYHYAVLTVIERHVLLHDQQYFIKVDGRCTALRMFNIVKSKLRILPLQKVILPEKLNMSREQQSGAEDDDDQQHVRFKIGEVTPEECFEEFRKRQVAGPMFKWTWSNWGVKCPVSMKEGTYKDGDPQFAVSFMNKLFYLSSEAAYFRFYRNPRPYLLPPFPKLSCRIFVMGPDCSGKTAVSKCLAHLLNGVVISPKELEEDFIERKKNEFRASITTRAINEGITRLKEQKRNEWELIELERQQKVKEWIQSALDLLNAYLKRAPKDTSSETSYVSLDRLSSFPVRLANVEFPQVEEEEGEVTEFSSKTFSQICLLLEEKHIPCYSLKDCTEYIHDPDKLLEFLPDELYFKEYEEEDISVFDDFINDYVDKALSEVDEGVYRFTTKDVFEMFSSKINEIETRNEEQGNGRGGWVIDGMPMDVELLEMLNESQMADDVFILHDDPDHRFLIGNLKRGNPHDFDDLRGFFLEIGKTDAAFRSPSKRNIDTIEDSDVEETSFSHGISEKKHRKGATERYKKHLEMFNERMTATQDFFSNKSVRVTKVEITGKSMRELLENVVENVDDRYRVHATVFGPEERTQEMLDLGEAIPIEDEPVGEEAEDEKAEMPDFFENRRYGDTLYYCPVTFHDHWVLWRGKEEYVALFEDKLYFLSSENALNLFLQRPRSYLRMHKPPSSFPPPRICVTGAKGSGKTTVSKALCENFGLYYVNYYDLLKREDISQITDLSIADSDQQKQNINDIDAYIKNEKPLSEYLLNSILRRCWFEEPLKFTGFVLDDFPFRPSDVDYMEHNFFIPDIILELSIPEPNLRKRNLDILMQDWRVRIDAEQKAQDEVNRRIMDEWETKRSARYKELMELKRETRYAERMQEKSGRHADRAHGRSRLEDIKETDEDTDTYIPVKSQVTFDSVAEQVDAMEVNEILAEELPEPVFEDNFETAEQAEERFDQELEELLLQQLDFIRIMTDYCDAEHIPWTKINADMLPDQIVAQAFIKCMPFKMRNRSCFESTMDVSVEISEKLLDGGYYFLSKFGMTCPVQYFENAQPVQMFLPLVQTFQIFPVIHRQYIYFLAGKDNRDKFRLDALKYTTQKVFNFPLIPLKVAVTGPPKCGKTCLSEKFHKEFGVKVITRGDAARYVIEYLPHTSLAKQLEDVLRRGWELTYEMVANCVEAASFDPKCVTQGMVFDGFPNTVEEVRHLSAVGLVPHLVLDLEASLEQIYHCLESDVGRRGFPKFSRKFISHRYGEWEVTAPAFKRWLDREYQILTGIPIESSKWSVWSAAYELTVAVFSEVQHYYKYAKYDWPLRLANMQVTPLEFLERISCYKTYCPCCLYYYNKLNDGGDPPDRTGLVQFRKYFYWICLDHIEEFLNCPDKFIPPYNPNKMPDELPERISPDKKPDNCFEQGVCIVCYFNELPKRILVEGSLEHAVSYRGFVYLFDSPSCLHDFLTNPGKYFNVEVKYLDTEHYPLLKYSELPTLGMLEQYVAKPIIKAVTHAGIHRPIIPGLDERVSAAVCIGLHLKLNNPETPKNYIPLYKEAQQKFEKRLMSLKYYLEGMKKTINPYLHYEEPMPEFSIPEPEKVITPEEITVSTQTTMTNFIDQILDNISYKSD